MAYSWLFNVILSVFLKSMTLYGIFVDICYDYYKLRYSFCNGFFSLVSQWIQKQPLSAVFVLREVTCEASAIMTPVQRLNVNST